ncbi:MAG TPA: hypothetical protein VME17_15430 [Bryobacteraceae bacterium]|nr:hypothetical protein [Bryobacteraceae bacterium]
MITTIPADTNLTAGQQLPPMVEVVWLRLQYGKIRDYMALAKSELIPEAKENGLKFYFVGQVVYGESAPQVEVVIGLPNWASMDQPPASSEAYRNTLAKERPLIVSREENIYRFRPDLSYSPPPAQSAQR